MNTIGTPNNIDVLMHCHTTPSVHERIDAPAVQSALKELMEVGAIEPIPTTGNRSFITTPLGKAWVQALCNVPPPRNVFVDEKGRVLESIFI